MKFNHLIEVTRYGKTLSVWIECKTYREYQSEVSTLVKAGFHVEKKAVMRSKIIQ